MNFEFGNRFEVDGDEWWVGPPYSSVAEEKLLMFFGPADGEWVAMARDYSGRCAPIPTTPTTTTCVWVDE